MSKFHTHEWDLLPARAFQPRLGRFGGMPLHGGKGGDAPEPDPNIGIAAQRQMDLAQEAYRDYKGEFQPLLLDQTRQAIRVAEDQNERATEMQTYQLGRAKTMDDRYDTVQIPLEDQLIGEAKAYNEDAERERMARTAGEDVGAAFSGAQDRIQRGLSARGVRMGSAAATAALGGLDTQRALAEASAVNKTRQAAKDIGWTRLGEAAALGRGLPSFGSTSAGLSLGAGQQALGAGTAGVGIVGSASGTNSAGYGASSNMFGSAASALNQQYATGVQAYSAEQANNPMNAILGAATGGAMAYFSGGLTAAGGKK